MKCPKCGYLELDPVERCRHCGYRFSLSPPTVLRAPELPLRSADLSEPDPLDDLELIDTAAAPPPPTAFDALSAAGRSTNGRGNGHAPSRAGESDVPDLPLFSPAAADDSPLITRASAPRAPLAVRRSTPEVPRLRTERPPPTEVPLPGLDRPSPGLRSGSERRPMPRAAAPQPIADDAAASIARRTVAAIIDLVVLIAIDAAVIYLTLQVGGLSWTDRDVLPKVPLVAFLLAQNFGYLVAFTVGGQSLGQMVTGVAVVAIDSDRPPPVGRAMVRAIVWMATLAVAGLGLLTIVFDRAHRGLHDHAAGTRVTRA
jgi:uncharacterized RDD family membrane protein YckC